jgi:NAD(P)-dependent dehydrogenase (short-subunit alcohol dehydrogenase family)
MSEQTIALVTGANKGIGYEIAAGLGMTVGVGARDARRGEEAGEVLETNVIGVVRVTNAMLPLLARSARPRIVNQSSHLASLTLQTTPEVEFGEVNGTYTPSKTFLNALTVQYAKELTNIKVNAACPGYVATDLNGFQGTSTPADGAKAAIRLATLPDDGPTGGLFDDAGTVPW